MDLADILIGTTRTFGLVALIAAGFGWAISATERGVSRGIAVGMLFSLGGIMSMTDPLHLAPGLIMDGRTVVVSLAYSFSGLVGSIIVCVSLAAYRLWIGGAGAQSGVVGIAVAALATAAFCQIPKQRLKRGWLRNGLLGLAGSSSLVTVLMLPPDLAAKVLRTAALPMVLCNVAGVMVLAQFLGREKQRLRLLRALEHDAAVDPLTKLVNRRVFDRMAQSVERRARSGDEHFSMIMIDVDNFKRVNDTLGHQAGDEILKTIAAIVRSIMRQSDVVARYGGEEIAILLPNTPIDIAAGLAERVRVRVQAELEKSKKWHMPVTVSAGVAAFRPQAPTVADVIRQADKALYRAKTAGRNRVQAEIPDAPGASMAA